jgi:hypothetical protein
MKLVVQIDYRLLSCKHFKLVKKHITSNSKMMENMDGKYDFKYTLSNLQHQDHKTTTNDDTSFDSLGSPYKTFKGVRNNGKLEKLRDSQFYLFLIITRNPYLKSI